MKKTILLLLLFAACKKNGPSTGTLNVEITNSQTGDPVTAWPGGITVYLYTSAANFGNQNAAFESAPVNSNGMASFPNIPVRQYYFFAQGQCGSNSGSDSATIGPIVGGTTNGITTTFTQTPGCVI